MKRVISLITVLFVLLALVLASGLGGTGISQTIAEPVNTPPPLGSGEPEVQLFPESSDVDVAPRSDGVPVADQRALLENDPLRSSGVIGSLREAVGPVDVTTQFLPSNRPTAPNEMCWTVLLNPEMDVVEFGDGTGSIEHWAIFWQNVFYSKVNYNSPDYGLMMMDGPISGDQEDTDIYSSNLDIDMFLQGFHTPNNLTYFRIDYSRLYADLDSYDDAIYRVYTLDENGYVSGQVTDTLTFIGETDPYVWTNRYREITSPITLTQLSGKSLALSFEDWTDRVTPFERIYLDDAQVTICAELNNKAYFPMVMNEPAPTGCNPIEPDSVDNRGYTVIDSTCSGAFSLTDTQDYYSLILNGASNVRLWLTDLPSGTNWTALIYRDFGDGTYNQECYIGTPGSADKYVDCTLNPAYDYFVRVYAGSAPAGTATYRMSVQTR